MKTYKIDDIFSEKVDKGSLFVLRTKDCLYYYIFVSYDKYDNGGFSLTDYWLVSDSWLDKSLNDNPNYVNFDYKLCAWEKVVTFFSHIKYIAMVVMSGV